MAVAPPTLVQTPTLVPPRAGLLSVAELVPTAGNHWLNGVEYATNGAAAVADDISCDPIIPADLPEGVPFVTDEPMRVHGGFTCKHPGLTKDEVNQQARDRFTAGEGPAVELGIWSRIQDDATSLGAAPVSIPTGLGDLEEWLYESYGGTGVLHVPRAAIPHLAAADQIVNTNGTLTTVLGTKISAGAYPGTGPADAAPAAGAVWVAATAAVQVRRSEIKVRTEPGASYFDFTDNSVVGLAERIYVVSWEHLAATAQLQLETVAP